MHHPPLEEVHCSMRWASRVRILLIVITIAMGSSQVTGQAIWSGSGATSVWSDAGNWSAGAPAIGSTTAFQFAGTSRLLHDNDLTGITATGITFNSGAGAFVIGGTGIALNGNLTNSSSNLQTLNLGLTLSADSTINTGASGITLGGVIDGGFGLSKSGTGILTLNGSNSFTGAVTLNAGTLKVGSNTALGATSGATTTVAGSVVELAGGVTVTGETITLNGTGDVNNTGALRVSTGDATWAGPIILGSGTGGGTVTGGVRLGSTGAGNLTVSGNITDNGNNFDLAIRSATGVAGKVILSGTNTYRDTYLVVGTLQMGAANTLPATTSLTMGNTSNQGTTVLELDGFNQQVASLYSSGTAMAMQVKNSSAIPATFTVSNGSFGGSLQGAIALTKTTSGTLTLSDATGSSSNSYTGLTSINAGSIVMSKSSALGSTAAGTVVASGAALVLNGSLTVGAETLSLAGSGISFNGALRAQTGTSTWAGAITQTAASEIQVDSGASLTIDVASGDAITGAFNLNLDSQGTLAVADPITIGAGTLTKSGTGATTFSGTTANTYTGATTVNAGTLILSKSTGVNALASTAITVGNNSGGLDILRLGNSQQIPDAAVMTLAGSGATAGVFQLNGFNETLGGVISSGGAGIIENEGGTSSTLTISSTATHSFSGIIRDGDGVDTDGTLSIVRAGTGMWQLSGANSYTGTTSITAGGIQVLSSTALGAGDGTAATGTTVNSGARLELGAAVTVANEMITINGTYGDNLGALRAVNGVTATLNGPVVLGSGTGTAGTRIGTLGVNSVLNLAGPVTDNGSGFDLAIRTDGSAGSKVIMSGASTYRDTYVVVGTLQLAGSDNRLPTATVLTMGNGSNVASTTADLNGVNQQIGGLTSLGTTMSNEVTNTSATPSVLTINNSSNYTYGSATGGGVSGKISGNLGIVKQGAGTQTLAGLNTYTGSTVVAAGTLSLTGSATIATTSGIDVAAGANLNVSGLTGGGLTYSPTSGDHPISGAGTITGSLSLGGVGYLSPGSTPNTTDLTQFGDGVGTLAITGGLTFSPSAATPVGQFIIGSSTLADKVTVGGALTLNSNSQFVVDFGPSYTQTWGDSWQLLDWAGVLTLNGFDANSASNLDLPTLDNGWTWQVSDFSGTGSLTVTIVPEPGRALLLGMGSALLVMRRRRNR